MFEYLDMGTHTFFVWLAYGVSFVSFVFLVWSSIYARESQKRKMGNKIERLNKLKASKKS